MTRTCSDTLDWPLTALPASDFKSSRLLRSTSLGDFQMFSNLISCTVRSPADWNIRHSSCASRTAHSLSKRSLITHRNCCICAEGCDHLLSCHSLRSGPSQKMQSDRQEVQCRAGTRNLGSYVLDSVHRRSNVRAHGFVLMDGDSLQGATMRSD